MTVTLQALALRSDVCQTSRLTELDDKANGTEVRISPIRLTFHLLWIDGRLCENLYSLPRATNPTDRAANLDIFCKSGALSEFLGGRSPKGSFGISLRIVQCC